MFEGSLRKLTVCLDQDNQVQYQLCLEDNPIALNQLIGQSIRLQFLETITCTHCSRQTKKSFAQGYCYPCFTQLAQCDLCIMKPELCHYDQGTCREPEWGQSYCMTPHIVYLANSSGVKVGITRANQVPTRWIDQGAIQALPILRVSKRYLSGLIESLFRQELSDRTQWQKMLKGSPESVCLPEIRDQLFVQFEQAIQAYQNKFGLQAIQCLTDEVACDIHYPVEQYPQTIKSYNFDKQPIVSGILRGIKGQYLILDTGVLNIRKFTGYHISFQAEVAI